MPLGPKVRALFGRHERRIADLYRAIFLDLADYGATIRDWAPAPRRILEVGCGEGAVTAVLAERFPDAAITAIDITPRAGRLYRGRTDGVAFHQTTVQEIARLHPGQFDLVVLSDVLHHVADDLRPEVLAAIGLALAPDGRFFLKDWGRSVSPVHWICHACDRWLTGDKVAHLTPAEAKRLVVRHVPKLKPEREGQIRPWRNNYAIVFA